MRAIRHDKRGDPSTKKRPADGNVLRDMLRTIEREDLRSYRDRALLAVGMAGAFCRSELVAITIGRVSDDTRGLLVGVPTSKTDQEGRGILSPFPMVGASSRCGIIAPGLRKLESRMVRSFAS